MIDGCGPTSAMSLIGSDPRQSSLKTYRGFSAPEAMCAYAAGLIDGEGYIGITKSRVKSKSARAYYAARVEVGMTNPARPLLHKMESAFGGKVVRSRETSQKWMGSSHWRMHGAEAALFLWTIWDHLSLKKRQAAVVIGLQKMIASQDGWSDESRRVGEEAKQEIHRLNEKGPPTMDENAFAMLVDGRWVTGQMELFGDQGWTEFSGTWPKWGSMRSGECFQRRELEHLTSGNGCSSWPTATEGDSRSSGSRNTPESKAHPVVSLTDAVTTGDSRGRRWQTPNTEDSKASGGEKSRAEGRQAMLHLQARRWSNLKRDAESWPTPSATSYGTNQGGGMGRVGPVRPSLQHLSRHHPETWTGGAESSPSDRGSSRRWKTPQTADAQGSCRSKDGRAWNLKPQVQDMTGKRSARLNPFFVEWLMGFPPGWTDCGRSATRSYRRWLRSHSRLLRSVLDFGRSLNP